METDETLFVFVQRKANSNGRAAGFVARCGSVRGVLSAIGTSADGFGEENTEIFDPEKREDSSGSVVSSSSGANAKCYRQRCFDGRAFVIVSFSVTGTMFIISLLVKLEDMDLL